MNCKGEFSNTLSVELLYWLALIVFFGLMIYYVSGFRNNSALNEEIYAKELARIIDSSSSGAEFALDVTKLTAIAKKSGITPGEVFSFDSVDKTIVVRLQPGNGASFHYFTNLTVASYGVKSLWEGTSTNRLVFKLA